MAVKASGTITLSSVVDVKATYRYYLLQSSTLTKPSKPTTNPPSTSWNDAEPSYVDGSTNTLYLVDLTVFSDDTWSYSEVSVSSSYEAAKSAYNKAVNAQNTANSAKESIDNLEIGGRNLLPNTDFNGELKKYEIPTGGTSEGGFWFTPTVEIESGIDYTLSAKIRGSSDVVFYEINDGGNVSHYWIKKDNLNADEYQSFSITFKVDTSRTFRQVYICTKWGASVEGDWFEIEPRSLKLEKGNKATDWSPAPEDMATSEDVSNAQANATEALDRVAVAESIIQTINDVIVTMVTDGNGASLMTQTENGWTFNTVNIQEAIDAAINNLDILTNDVGEVTNTLDILQQAMNDLGEIAEYVKITTYDDEPCIELGEADSDFKLRITNTRMMFTDGENVVAHFNNQSLHIKKAVIEEELQQGQFVWKARSNGNLGLMWKGV